MNPLINLIIRITMYLLKHKFLDFIVQKTNGLNDITINRIYFTKSNPGDRFPSSNPYDEAYPITFFINHNIICANIFVNDKNVLKVININKIYFIWFILINQLLLKFNKLILFRLTDLEKCRLSNKNNNTSDYPSHVNFASEYELIKNFYNSNIVYNPEKKLIDHFCNKFHIKLS